MRNICLKRKILLRGIFLPGCLLFCLLLSVLNCNKANAQSYGNPITVDWQNLLVNRKNAPIYSCYTWENVGRACNLSGALVDSFVGTIRGFPSNGLYLINITYSAEIGHTENYTGFSSGQNFVIIEQNQTQVGNQIKGNVVALTYASNGVTNWNSDTRYNNTDRFDIVFTRPGSVPLFNENGQIDLSRVEGYLQNISWNSTETQKKLERIISLITTGNSNLGVIEWNSTQTQVKLEQIISLMGSGNSNTGAIEEAVKEGNEAQQNRWDEEDKKAEDAINSEQDTGADGSDEMAKEGLNLFKLILETPAGSCKLPEISAFGFSLGEMNLCTYSPPSWIQQVLGAVVTIILAGASIKCTVRVLETLGHAYGGTR